MAVWPKADWNALSVFSVSPSCPAGSTRGGERGREIQFQIFAADWAAAEHNLCLIRRFHEGELCWQ